MIGGSDIVCELRVDDQDADFVVRFFAAAWPESVVRVPDLGREGPVGDFLNRPTTGAPEWFFYRDEGSRELWREHGLTDEAADAVVFVTFEPDAVCFVVDADASVSGKLVHELCLALRVNRQRVFPEAA